MPDMRSSWNGAYRVQTHPCYHAMLFHPNLCLVDEPVANGMTEEGV